MPAEIVIVQKYAWARGNSLINNPPRSGLVQRRNDRTTTPCGEAASCSCGSVSIGMLRGMGSTLLREYGLPLNKRL